MAEASRSLEPCGGTQSPATSHRHPLWDWRLLLFGGTNSDEGRVAVPSLKLKMSCSLFVDIILLPPSEIQALKSSKGKMAPMEPPSPESLSHAVSPTLGWYRSMWPMEPIECGADSRQE